MPYRPDACGKDTSPCGPSGRAVNLPSTSVVLVASATKAYSKSRSPVTATRSIVVPHGELTMHSLARRALPPASDAGRSVSPQTNLPAGAAVTCSVSAKAAGVGPGSGCATTTSVTWYTLAPGGRTRRRIAAPLKKSTSTVEPSSVVWMVVPRFRGGSWPGEPVASPPAAAAALIAVAATRSTKPAALKTLIRVMVRTKREHPRPQDIHSTAQPDVAVCSWVCARSRAFVFRGVRDISLMFTISLSLSLSLFVWCTIDF